MRKPRRKAIHITFRHLGWPYTVKTSRRFRLGQWCTVPENPIIKGTARARIVGVGSEGGQMVVDIRFLG